MYKNNFPYLSDKADAWGQFGDYIGGLLNPIIAACTLFVAMRVWALQEKELKETRDELKSQRNQQRFFDLLHLYQEVVRQISLPNSKDKTGKSALENEREFFEERLPPRWSELRASAACDDSPCRLGVLQLKWEKSNITHYLSSYFGTIEAMLTEARTLLGNDAHRYISIFTLQLSQAELIWIAYYMLLDDRSNKFKKIACEYGLLRHLNHKASFKSLLSDSDRLFSAPPNYESETTPC